MKFIYGDSWEKYPIKTGETWIERDTGSIVSVCDIIETLPDYMMVADMVYVDPPWNLGNANGFYTKAGLQDRYIDNFSAFYKKLFSRITAIKPRVCYIEVGLQNKLLFMAEMVTCHFPMMQAWDITYYRKNPCVLIRGGDKFQTFDFTGMDEADTPSIAIEQEKPRVVADLCTGQGLTAIAAYRQGKKFVGTELNPRRLAVAIDRVNKIGGKYECAVSEGYLDCNH